MRSLILLTLPIAFAWNLGTSDGRAGAGPRRTSDVWDGRSGRCASAGACATADAASSMLHRRPDDSDHVVWRGPLVNNPVWAWVDPARGWMTTMGNECRYDLQHAVVIYDQAGRVVRDLNVGQLLTLDERRRIGFEEFVDTPRRLDEHERTGNDLWRSGGEVVFTPDTVSLTHPRIERRVLLARR